MPSVRVKICGLTSLTDALIACEAGADAIGLVFYAPSPRNVDIALARHIAENLPPFVQVVGLFVNPERDWVDQVLAAVPLDLLQFHGSEDEAFCASFAKPYLKAFAMKDGVDIDALMSPYHSARGFLLDAWHPEKPGGTGERFDWQRFPAKAQRALILAGGLSADNVAQAIAQCKPYAVDVSGGVEASPGIKSAEKVKAFIREAKSVVLQGK